MTDPSTVVPNPRISAGSIVGSTGPVPPQPLDHDCARPPRSLRPLTTRWAQRTDRESCVLLDSRSHINVGAHRRPRLITSAAVRCSARLTLLVLGGRSATAQRSILVRDENALADKPGIV